MAANIKKGKRMVDRYILPEIVSEIFLNLPCKSLCKFRSISKQYHSYVNNPQFIEKHRRRNLKASHLLIWDDSVISSNLHLFNMHTDSYAYMKTIATYSYENALPSSYGMVCLHGGVNKKIALFNPSSEEIIPLPDLLEPFAYETKNKPGAPTPTTWKYNDLGFGFDPKSRRYKVVQTIIRDCAISGFHILTVSRKDSYWRTINMSSGYLVGRFRCEPICVDGALYWEIWNSFDGIHIPVLVFDLGTEEMRIIQSPAEWRFDKYGSGWHFALLKGRFCCYDMTPPVDTLLEINIWKLEECGFNRNNNAIWTPWYKLEIYRPVLEQSPLVPLYIYGDRRILFQDPISERFYCYDIEGKSLKTYPMVEKVEGVSDEFRFIVYSETISPSID